ncbi:MAG: hypothetical protein BM485_13670 [Desulfobulbaceae bacterium DB1]|nr:MAG: hypothetical protein BM485_13670 [Desulfobulbaceae bacterium DB1]
MANPVNLDQIAAVHAQQMVANVKKDATDRKKAIETLERLATKSLGVLQEQGVYALLLFLFSRSSEEEKLAPIIRCQLCQALSFFPSLAIGSMPDTNNPQKLLDFFSTQVAENLDTLFLVRDLYEQTLIYARFGAKAAKE